MGKRGCSCADVTAADIMCSGGALGLVSEVRRVGRRARGDRLVAQSGISVLDVSEDRRVLRYERR